MNTIYKIARYEQLNNNIFLVAFNVKDDSDSWFYIESQLDMSEISEKTPNEVCQLAYSKIKDKIDSTLLRLQQENATKVGYQFIPQA